MRRIASFLVIVVCFTTNSLFAAERARPNIVFILADDK